jgi:hypothetical protein
MFGGTPLTSTDTQVEKLWISSETSNWSNVKFYRKVEDSAILLTSSLCSSEHSSRMEPNSERLWIQESQTKVNQLASSRDSTMSSNVGTSLWPTCVLEKE